MNEQIICFQSQVFHLPFTFLKSTGFKFFAKIIGENYVFCCSSHISFNPSSHLKNFAIFIAKHLCWSLFLIRLFQQKCFPANIANFLRTPILKNICERLRLNVVFSNICLLNWMKWDKIIILYIYLYYFGIIRFVFYPEAVVRKCYLKSCF